MTAPQVRCQLGECTNAAFGKVDGLWMCDDCRVERLRDYMELPNDNHDCMENAVPYVSDGALGHGWECGRCGAFLQAG